MPEVPLSMIYGGTQSLLSPLQPASLSLPLLLPSETLYANQRLCRAEPIFRRHCLAGCTTSRDSFFLFFSFSLVRISSAFPLTSSILSRSILYPLLSSISPPCRRRIVTLCLCVLFSLPLFPPFALCDTSVRGWGKGGERAGERDELLHSCAVLLAAPTSCVHPANRTTRAATTTPVFSRFWTLPLTLPRNGTEGFAAFGKTKLKLF